MSLVRILAAAMGAAGTLAACNAQTGAQWPTLPPNVSLVGHEVIDGAHSAYSGILEPRRQVIRDAQAWAAFWDEFHTNVDPKPALPPVDFTRHMVLAAAMGQRSSGGYAITIEEVHAGTGLMIARVLEQSPGEECMVTGALTAPATAVLVPQSDGDVEFQEARRVVSCG